VVASRISAIPEVCGDAVQYFNPQDIEDMSTQILKLLLHDDVKADLIGKGKKQIEKFSWDRAANETLKIYQSVLE